MTMQYARLAQRAERAGDLASARIYRRQAADPISYSSPSTASNGGVSVTDCRDDVGVTVGLIDAIISIARIAARRDLSPQPVQESLADIASDEDVRRLVTFAT